MFAQFLIPETTATKDGNGPAVALGEHQGTLLRLTLGVTRIVEQESLDISIHGSADGSAWSAKPIVSFPQKFTAARTLSSRTCRKTRTSAMCACNGR